MIKLTEKDIGKRVRFRDGSTGVIKKYNPTSKYSYDVILSYADTTIGLTTEGYYWQNGNVNEKDIIEILDDESEKTMNKFKVGDRVRWDLTVGPISVDHKGYGLEDKGLIVIENSGSWARLQTVGFNKILEVSTHGLIKMEKTMNRREAVLAMLDGKKVKHLSQRGYISFDTSTGFIFRNRHGGVRITDHISFNDGYEIYEEPLEEITVNGVLYRRVKL